MPVIQPTDASRSKPPPKVEAPPAVRRETPPGATVICECGKANFGKLVRALEWEADVFLIEHCYFLGGTCVKAILRSDIFPSGWEGENITAVINHDYVGIRMWYREPYDYLCRKDDKWQRMAE